MTEYRRIYVPNTTWFFTVNLAERHDNRLLIENIDLLRDCYRYVKQQKPFQINAIVILPDHMHSTAGRQEVEQRMERLPSIWTLPQFDSDYSIRWNMIKGRFSRFIRKGERISASRLKRRERGIYPRAQVATPILDTFDNGSRRL